MTQYIDKSALVAEIERRKAINEKAYMQAFLNSNDNRDSFGYKVQEDIGILFFIDTLEVKEVNEVPATVMVNKYGNRFISSWSGLKEYNDFKEGEEIKILIPKK